MDFPSTRQPAELHIRSDKNKRHTNCSSQGPSRLESGLFCRNRMVAIRLASRH